VRPSDFERLSGLMMARVATPSRSRCSGQDRDTFVAGLSVRCHPGSGDLLGVQLAVMVGDQVVSRAFVPPAAKIRRCDLLEMFRGLLVEVGLEVGSRRGTRRVAFVCHDASSVLAVFEDPFVQFEITRMGRGHLAVARHQHLHDGAWKITVVDLLSYFGVRLPVIGDAVGLPRISVDVASEDQELIARSTSRDAEIPLAAFLYLRRLLRDRWGIDPLLHRTPAAIGGEIFRRHYFTRAAAPYRVEYEHVPRRRADGKTWTTSRCARHVFAGELGVRDLAIRTLHGGRNEAFGRGLLQRPVLVMDVRSMYPSAARAMALPDSRTVWEPVVDPAGFDGREGFCQVAFAFPSDVERPCLPVRLASDTLLFPLAGESYCTLAEARLAGRLGATLDVVRAFGFKPTDREFNHDLGRYLAGLVEEKNSAKSGSLERQFYKDLLNQPLGKLGQKSLGDNVLAVERFAREQGFTGVAALLAKRPELTGNIRGEPDLGSLWSPEQLGLILGKARALIGEILVVSRAHSVSTDSVIVDRDASISCTALDELRAVGSDMPVEVEADALFISGARKYALLARAESVALGSKIVARDGTWAILKASRQGSRESESQFGETLLACLASGANVAPVRTVTRRLKPEEAVRKGRPFGSADQKDIVTRFEWDKKRVLHDRDSNPFRVFTGTRPYQTKNRREGAERAARVRDGVARRATRPVTKERRARVLAHLAAGHGVRQAARLEQLSPTTVASIRDRAAPTGPAPGGGGDAT
jgi:hypothetical protein